ncbi:MAG: prepilin-type N-terminal cleavage/methylation domain-containing protein, partial [Bacilli bacterium]|nr:prepilin-type N-terminal cleavage/methylation domain-containing protein [Bacilli bacterium]
MIILSILNRRVYMNRKGFTLVEILGTITILGIISSIAIISITRILYNAKVE